MLKLLFTRRRREKRQKDKHAQGISNQDDVEEYQGETGPLDMPIGEIMFIMRCFLYLGMKISYSCFV